jgi:hypothetical protein
MSLSTVKPARVCDDAHAPLTIGTQRKERLARAIEHAAHFLPAQGPITVFIHHNTLHAFENLPFTEAVKRAARVFGCQPYLTEGRYRQELRRGRIQRSDLEAVLREELGDLADERILGFGSRLELRLAMLEYPLQRAPEEELHWFVAETDALRRVRREVSQTQRLRLIAETRRWTMRDLRGARDFPTSQSAAANDDRRRGLLALLERFGDRHIESWTESTWEAFTLQALWRICCDGVQGVPELTLPPLPPVRHRDLLREVASVDSDEAVHELLIRFCAAFLDQGLSHWPLPRRDEGFFRCFAALYQHQPAVEAWLKGLSAELRRHAREQIGPLESIEESLGVLGVEEEEWEEFFAATLLALRGWAGIMRFLEERPDRAVHAIPPGSLVEFLAVRMLLERLALAHFARQSLGYDGPLSRLRDELRGRLGRQPPSSVNQRAFRVFELAQFLGWTPQELHRLSEAEWAALVEEIEIFSPIERRRIFHLAYERQFYARSLDAVSIHNRVPRQEPAAARFQAMFCIDEREESLRRHVEEVAPDCQTFGIAGFYFLDMYYKGAADAHFVPLCPAVMTPGHWVVEDAVAGLEARRERSAKVRRAMGMATHQVHRGSRTLAIGAMISAAVGVLASVPLIARTLFPRLTSRFRQTMGHMVAAPPKTRLVLERRDSPPGPENGHIGFTLEEMVDVAERVLRDTGLTSGFARMVITLGHGSTSMNNPHESAHDCGACGGARGGANGRAIAQILNDPRVRQRLAERGIAIGAETAFVGGMHNTSSDAITWYDLDCLPASHEAEFAAVQATMEEAASRNAHERCRRFESAPLTISTAGARQHVEGRAEDLAQVRPEWGHATNALCIVGRRCRTRGLFLDRRAFLNSYDPTQDDADASILARILAAAVPVCAGISLEYYFSYVDNRGYGCGTKLPHNIVALLGVMDGAASDLRTGLPWQMVEIHEPVRILFVVETTPKTMLRILERNPVICRLVRNGWVRLATLDPHSPEIHIYRNGGFERYQPQSSELPRAASSADWYRGWRDHLDFAEIDSSAADDPPG